MSNRQSIGSFTGMDTVTAPQEFKLIDIREVWPGEASDFTPWLADNLDALSNHLEIGELELDRTEVEVPGGRRLDILAKDGDGGNWAVENQYGEADHDHLTRALAYAVGLECRAVIVVAESHRDEFVAVADEWNRYSEAYGPDGIRLFLVAIEAGRIGDSRPGFRFRLVAGPNEWKSAAATGTGERSEADQVRDRERSKFWSELRKMMTQKGNLTWSTTGRRVYQYITVWRKKPFDVNVVALADKCRVELYMDTGDKEENDRLFDELAADQEEIDRELGIALEWLNKPGVRSSKVYWEPEGVGGYRSPSQERQAGHKVLADAIYRFHGILIPYVERLV